MDSFISKARFPSALSSYREIGLNSLPPSLPTRLFVKVTPKAKISKIQKTLHPDGSLHYTLAVHAAPEDGKANKAVIEAIAKDLNIPKSRLEITHGLTSREKILKIN